VINRTPLMAVLAAAFLVTAAATAAPPFSYRDYSYGSHYDTRAATLELDSAELVGSDSHVAVWLAASDQAGSWVQAGLYKGVNDAGGMCVYAEMNDARSGGYWFRCLRPASLGDRVRVRITLSNRHGAVIWVDGQPAASVRLGTRVLCFAMAEKRLRATMSYRITAADESLADSW